MPLPELLRHRLLQAGIAPSHIGRYLCELEEHLADLVAEEGGGSAAYAPALRRLGTLDELASAMTSRDCFRSWTARAPWTVFPASALAGLACGYLGVTLLLYLAVKAFCPLVDGHPMPPVWLPPAAEMLFAVNRFLLPLLVGWGVAALALSRRQISVWPIVAMIVSALIGSGLYCQADWPATPRSWGFSVTTLLNASPALFDGWSGYGAMVVINLCAVLTPYLYLSRQRSEAI